MVRYVVTALSALLIGCGIFASPAAAQLACGERGDVVASLQNKFSETLIVETKTEKVFREFCEQQGADPTLSWVVGDSIRSDVKPALDAGMNAVLFEAPNWDIEHVEEKRPFERIKTLADLPKAILRHSAR